MYLYEMPRYGAPPGYSPSYSPPSWDFLAPRTKLGPPNVAPGPYYAEVRPQHFYHWLSPPGVVRAMACAVAALCFITFTCVASTLMWDFRYSYPTGPGGYGFVGGFGTGYYGSGHTQYGKYPSPYAAKVTMMTTVTLTFLVSSAILVASFAKASTFRGRSFYLLVVMVDSAMAFIQGVINIVYAIGINPTSQSSQSMLYNPVLMMCQKMYEGSPAGAAGVFPVYNQHLYHYCFMDPQEVVALVCSFLAVLALAIAACYAQKTRGKIWHHGKNNIFWERHKNKGPRALDVEDWVNNIEGDPSVRTGPTVLLSEKALTPLHMANSVVSVAAGTDSVASGGNKDGCVKPDYPECPPTRTAVQGGMNRASSTPSEDSGGPPLKRAPVHTPRPSESPYETGYASGGDSDTEPDSRQWQSMYPKITSAKQRQEYKRMFDSDLHNYKQVCAQLDHISSQLRQLSHEIDVLPEGAPKRQALAEEYSRLKELKRAPIYQSQKHQCRELQRKLIHIKRQVRNYDAHL